MAESEKEKEGPAGPVGVVRVGDLAVTVTPLTLAEERGLRRLLRAGAQAAAGKVYERAAKLLEALRAAPDAYLEAVRELTRQAVAGPTPEQVWEYRESPEGVAAELYARGKKATPGLDPKGLQAVVTAANVDDVAAQLEAVLLGKVPTPPSSQG